MLTHTQHAARLLALALATGALALGACESSSTSTTAKTKPSGPVQEEPMIVRGERPVLLTSAVERASSTELAFFDELETRPLAAQDDAVHAALLLGTGSSGQTARHRVQLAQALRYLPTHSLRPSREAVTVGEVSQLFAAVLVGQRQRSADDAVGLMVSKGVLKANLPAYQGMTGAQLVSMIGAAQDVMQSTGVAKVTLPNILVTQNEPVMATTPAQAPATQVASPAPTNKGWVGGSQVKPQQEATVDPSKPANP
jgi:hypothetical protein